MKKKHPNQNEIQKMHVIYMCVVLPETQWSIVDLVAASQNHQTWFLLI